MSKHGDREGVFIDSLVVAFDVDGEELRLYVDTSELPGNSFPARGTPLNFKIKGMRGHAFMGAEEFANPDAYVDIFIPIWGTAHEIHYDIEVTMVKDRGVVTLEESSVKATHLSLFHNGAVVPLEDYDQEILKPFREGRVISGTIRTVVKGSKK
jgi:hypothetical protein